MKKITRRVFIISTILAGTGLALLPQKAKTHIEIELFKTLEAVQNVLFPEGLDAPSAKEFGATSYLANVSTHSSFLKSDLTFLKKGVKELIKSNNDFLTLPQKEQDRRLREFSKSKLGKNWIGFVLYFTLEALLSDPIYGGNKNELGWRWLGHHTGQPQPKKPFAQLLESNNV